MRRLRDGTGWQRLRRTWHRVNPYWLEMLTRSERGRAQLQAFPARMLRTTWPSDAELRSGRVAIVSVNYNTAAHIAHLVFSLYRVLGADQFGRLLIVDNASTDGSVELLRGLSEAGLADVIFNSRQRYHGPALNQAMNHLANLSRKAALPSEVVDAVWILDSDCIVLRRNAVSAPLSVLRASSAGLLGELQDAAQLTEYAHPSSVLVDPRHVWQRRVRVFEESGTPARGMHVSLRRLGIGIQDFPYRAENYVLHLGRATLGAILQSREKANRYFDWAEHYGEHDYHGNPHGRMIHDQFLSLFRAEVMDNSVAALVRACRRESLVTLELPLDSAGSATRKHR